MPSRKMSLFYASFGRPGNDRHPNRSDLRNALRAFRAAKKETLRASASTGSDKAQLLTRFDAFRRGGNAQLAGERHDAANHRSRLPSMNGFTDKRTVDLQRVEQKRHKFDSVEKPVPKSSSASPIPIARSFSTLRRVGTSSLMSTVSVTSMFSGEGGNPDSCMTAATRSANESSRNCTGDTFTATTTGSRQRAASAQERRSTHSPSGRIRPVRSAMGTKVVGGNSPRVGCVQRTSASRPVTSPLARLTIG